MAWKGIAQDFLFVGDIHGRHSHLVNLWNAVKKSLSPERFQLLNVVFMGDYIDRGPNTKEVIDFLVRLPERNLQQKHTFLCGNHDFALAAFLSLPPFSFKDYGFSEDEFVPKPGSKETPSKWYNGTAAHAMHVQGRRWAAPGIYESEPTFESYGVKFADREGLFNALPYTHRSFFSSLHWLFKVQTSFGRVLAVHAGLENSGSKNLSAQLEDLDERFVSGVWVEPLMGRRNVEPMPTSLIPPYLQVRTDYGRVSEAPRPIFLVSGHHGFLKLDGHRLIVDGNEEKLRAVLLSNQYNDYNPKASETNSLLDAGLQERFLQTRFPSSKTPDIHKSVYMEVFEA